MAERRGQGEGPRPIRFSIEQVAGRLSRTDLVGFAAVEERWAEVVGEQIAAHARPLKLIKSTLVVAVDQPAWATQLRLLADKLRAGINEVPNVEVAEIEVVVRAL